MIKSIEDALNSPLSNFDRNKEAQVLDTMTKLIKEDPEIMAQLFYGMINGWCNSPNFTKFMVYFKPSIVRGLYLKLRETEDDTLFNPDKPDYLS